ncbi:hypothetical protein [uncultured Friedmanniella sp.]|uniref:hypothetical protein n=1 Tax=uncultured Friedmanniella sp. TaxID=335381 RepID=UPI0035CA3D0D
MRARLTRATAVALAALTFSACSARSPSAPAPTLAPTPTATASSTGPTPASSVEPAEPTTTNTLPPPPAPTAPAPSTAGDLRAAALPVPAGWRTVAKEGGDEEGFRGNGTWVHARDARYAAQDVITIGCADVTRDDYPDPVAALEGSYVDRDGNPGVGLALEFTDAEAASRYWSRYTDQVRACTPLADPVHIELVPLSGAGADELVDRRTYPDSEWTEVAKQSGTRVTLVILTDAGHRITAAKARTLLTALG